MEIQGLPRQVNYVLLDFDGTIIDLRPKWWYPIEQSFKEVSGDVPTRKLTDKISEIMATLPQKPSRLYFLRLLWSIGRSGGLSRIETIRFIFSVRQKFDESKYINKLLPGSEQFVQLLIDRGIPVVIVTTARSEEIEVAKSQINVLQSIPVVTRDDVDHLKPHPEPVEVGMRLVDADPKTTVFVGDFDTDILSGKAAGVMTIGLTGVAPDISRPGLRRAEPDLIVNSLSDLIDFIRNQIQSS